MTTALDFARVEALKAAVDFCAGTPTVPDRVVEIAGQFEDYLKGKTPPTTTTVTYVAAMSSSFRADLDAALALDARTR